MNSTKSWRTSTIDVTAYEPEAGTKTQKRIRILSDDEIEELYARPEFSPDERAQFFAMSPSEKEVLQSLRSLKSQAYFVLQLGYFKAKRLFFVFSLAEVIDDTEFVLQQHFDGRTLNDRRAVDKKTRLKQQRLILQLLRCRHFKPQDRENFDAKAAQAASVCGKPVYIFRELTRHLEEHRIVVPGYSFMQDTVGAAITAEQNRLASTIRRELPPSAVEALNQLLDDPEGLHEITLLKREPKDFSASEIKREIQRGEQIADLYCLAQNFTARLKAPGVAHFGVATTWKEE